ncbi:MAG: PKD domain-containing protein [Gemmatimonadaceae bacterium]
MAACSSSTLEPKPLDVTVQASRTTAAPGDTIDFLVHAQGGTLFGVQIEYGDGIIEQFPTAGARTARHTFRHPYKLRGTFLVRVTVTDAVAGQKEATVEVRVT